jgi:hypothetical protein
VLEPEYHPSPSRGHREEAQLQAPLRKVTGDTLERSLPFGTSAGRCYTIRDADTHVTVPQHPLLLERGASQPSFLVTALALLS